MNLNKYKGKVVKDILADLSGEIKIEFTDGTSLTVESRWDFKWRTDYLELINEKGERKDL